MDISTLKFDEKGLIPAIVIDTETRAVLTLAYMNAESLEISMAEGKTCFWSRSRRELWRKGETSGNYQRIVSITADCDGDALLVEVRPEGPACHTGEASCFHKPIFDGPEAAGFSYAALFETLRGRRESPVEGSYTSYLFEKGGDKILKKLGEEATEVIIAAKDRDKPNTVYELGDLLYHAMVLMLDMGIEPEDIKKEMASRHVIDRKIKQERMVGD